MYSTFIAPQSFKSVPVQYVAQGDGTDKTVLHYDLADNDVNKALANASHLTRIKGTVQISSNEVDTVNLQTSENNFK